MLQMEQKVFHMEKKLFHAQLWLKQILSSIEFLEKEFLTSSSYRQIGCVGKAFAATLFRLKTYVAWISILPLLPLVFVLMIAWNDVNLIVFFDFVFLRNTHIRKKEKEEQIPISTVLMQARTSASLSLTNNPCLFFKVAK